MARDQGGKSGKGGGKAQMAQPAVQKYRKHIGTYQRENTQKEAKRNFRDVADAKKGINIDLRLILRVIPGGKIVFKTNNYICKCG